MAQHFQQWALPQIQRLLPLDDESLKQIITYTDTLPKAEAADHLKNLLGDSPQAFEFISAFNHRRPKPPSESAPAPSTRSNDAISEVPKTQRRQPKKKAAIHTPPARQVDPVYAPGYVKKRDEDDYMPSSSRAPKPHAQPSLANTVALQGNPDAKQLPAPSVGLTPSSISDGKQRMPPSAAGSLISDLPSGKSSKQSSRAASPNPATTKAKVNITGGAQMRGQSAALNDLDSAIRALELQTNPSLASADASKRRCPCMAQRHALLAAAPNCMRCGKIICAKEGIGPCTFCGTALLTADELQAMVRILKDERGTERMQANNAAHKRPDVAKAPRAFQSLTAPGATNSSDPTPSGTTPSNRNDENTEEADAERLARAKQHRDKLLKFQAENARRTRIHDEAADFETPDAGLSQWASPQERALQLKKQQKILREQEWNARPEYEKRQAVVSIDLVGGKAVRRMQEVKRSETPEGSEDEGDGNEVPRRIEGERGGAFSRNPLLGSLIRPVWKAEEGADKGKGRESSGAKWRRVQDDHDDDAGQESWVLDGGVYGDHIDGRVMAEEPSCG